MTQAINHAKDTGDLDLLREIADDPAAFIRKQGWASIELGDQKEIKALRHLFEMLQIKIAEVIEATEQLKESSDYELYNLAQQNPSILDTVSQRQKEEIQKERERLIKEAQDLEDKIKELTGELAF